MSVILILIVCSLSVASLFAAAFLWSVRSGQFDDPEANAVRMLIDNSEPVSSSDCDAPHIKPSNATKQP